MCVCLSLTLSLALSLSLSLAHIRYKSFIFLSACLSVCMHVTVRCLKHCMAARFISYPQPACHVQRIQQTSGEYYLGWVLSHDNLFGHELHGMAKADSLASLLHGLLQSVWPRSKTWPLERSRPQAARKQTQLRFCAGFKGFERRALAALAFQGVCAALLGVSGFQAAFYETTF